MPDAQPHTPIIHPKEPPPDLTGRILGDYQLLRRLGTGGMGQVYLARQLSLKREVALKLLRDDLTNNAVALQRFQAEAEAVARLNHPNIVHIHQIGDHDGLRYMVLEYVEGRNLRDYLARKGPPDLAIALSIIKQVVLALQKAHEVGIVHRDIKPENILLTRKVDVKVADFGLSRFFAGERTATNLTQSGVTLGTPLYMAPEQVQGHTLDHRTDIYSLGVTCFHLLAGEPPFRGTTAFDVALKHVQEQPPSLAELRPDLPADLCGMVHKMMAKNPADRYQSAREILRDLTKIRDGVVLALGHPQAPLPSLSLTVSGVPLPWPRAPEPAPPSWSKRWGRWMLAALACLLAATAGALASSQRMRTTDPNPGETITPPATAGLPEIRPVDKLVTTRERELLAMLGNREKATPEEVLKGSIELGLLYVHEGRLDDAQSRFERLEKEQFPATGAKKVEVDFSVGRYTSMAGRLGQAIVVAHRNTPDAAQKSIELVARVVNDPFPRASKFDKIEKGYPAVANFLLRYPELAEAVAEALNRDIAAQGKTSIGMVNLDAMRHPPKGKKE